jgi:H+/gluconate symporter-like permease
MPEPASTIQRWLDVLGNLNIALAAAVIAITTVLAMRSGESGRWSTISRFLP